MFIYRELSAGADEQVAMAGVRSEALNIAARNGRNGAPITFGVMHRMEPMRDSFVWASFDDNDVVEHLDQRIVAAE